MINTATKLFILAFLGLSLITPEVFAQGAGQNVNPADRATRTLTQLKEQIGISDAQADSLRPVLIVHYTKMQELRAQFATDRQGAMAKRSELQAELDKKIEAVLVGEQVTRYREYVKARQGRRGQGTGPGAVR